MWLLILLISVCAVNWSTVSAAPDKIICYHGTWSHWRPGNGKFVIADIDTNLCTHIIYTFVGINGDGTIRLNSDDLDCPGFLNEYKKLKQRAPTPTLILAIGGRNEGTVNFSKVAANATLRKTLLENAIRLIRQYDFDGFNFDWQYPEVGDISNFVKLLEEFRAEFNKYGYLLMAAVPQDPCNYDVPGIVKSLDSIIIKTCDLGGSCSSVTIHHSSFLDSVTIIINWIIAGVPTNKLILLICTYGRSFTLTNASNNAPGAPIRSGGTAGRYTSESGILGYNEICEKLTSGWTRRWINDLSVPYAFSGDQWVGYDDPESIAVKTTFVVNSNLGGICISSVETDDFRGTCNCRYPLLNAIKTGLKLQNVPCTGSGNSSTPAPCVCRLEGYVRDPIDCSKYYYCQLNGNTCIAHSFQCGSGLYFDMNMLLCNWPSLVSCP